MGVFFKENVLCQDRLISSSFKISVCVFIQIFCSYVHIYPSKQNSLFTAANSKEIMLVDGKKINSKIADRIFSDYCLKKKELQTAR